jgi:hypothetical protein
VYAGAFLIETLHLADVLAWKASNRTRVRVLVGDADSDAVRLRAAELSIAWLPERCSSTRNHLISVPGIGLRSHGAAHYVSPFRFDDLILANTHAYGSWSCHASVIQLRRDRSDSLFKFYAGSFERLWVETRPDPSVDRQP